MGILCFASSISLLISLFVVLLIIYYLLFIYFVLLLTLDVIGMMTAIAPEREYVRDGKVTRMVVLELTYDR